MPAGVEDERRMRWLGGNVDDTDAVADRLLKPMPTPLGEAIVGAGARRPRISSRIAALANGR